MQSRLLLSLSLLCATASAQTTWIVNAGGGPGINFTDLPSAVAAAASGDTIIVQTGPLNEGAEPFTTSKGLTIVGEGGVVPISTSAAAPIEIVDLPAGTAFRMVGFDRSSNGELNFRIMNCQGQVHLERLRCREPDVLLPLWPAIEISNCVAVTMREVATFGAPAVSIAGSTVSLVECRLGVTHIGLGGGRAIAASDSAVVLVQPLVDTGSGVSAAVTADNCQLSVAGISSSYLRNPGGSVVDAIGGAVRVDPAVTLQPATASPAITGTAIVTTATVPATWTWSAQPAQVMAVATHAATGAVVFVAVGRPGVPIGTPLGVLAIDGNQPYAFWPPVTFNSLVDWRLLGVPATLPLGAAFVAQAVVLDCGSLSFGLPCTFVVH